MHLEWTQWWYETKTDGEMSGAKLRVWAAKYYPGLPPYELVLSWHRECITSDGIEALRRDGAI